MVTHAIPQALQQAARRAPPRTEQGVASTLLRGAVGSMAIQVAGMCAAFGSQVGLAHLLGSAAFGQYVYIVSLVSLVAVVARCGLDVASLRFIAEYRARGDQSLLRGFVRRSLQCAAVASIVFAGLGIIASLVYAQSFAPEALVPCLLGVALLTVLSWQGLFTAQLRAVKRVMLSQLPKQLLSPIAVVALTYAAVLVTGERAGATTALTSSLLANGCLLLLVGRVAMGHLRSDFGQAEPRYDSRTWRSCSLSLLVVGIVQVINLRIDVLMVGAMCGMEAAGIYTAASQLAGLSLIGLIGVNAIAAPMISEMHAKGRRAEFQRFLQLAAWGICLVTLPLAVGLITMGAWLLGLFGSDFVSGYPALVALVLGQAVSALIGPVGFLVIMTGNQRQGAWIFGSGAVLNIWLNLLLIPKFGLVGAAAATAIAIGCGKLIMLVFIFRKLHVNPTVFPSPRRMSPDSVSPDAK